MIVKAAKLAPEAETIQFTTAAAFLNGLEVLYYLQLRTDHKRAP